MSSGRHAYKRLSDKLSDNRPGLRRMLADSSGQ